MGIQYAYAADIVKSERDEETGDLIVYGKATGPDLDLDEQICDADWLKTAMPAWFEWGNVREMHQPIAAGVGIELEEQGDDWYVKSRCVDPSTAAKIEAGVLKGYSVGIKDPKIVKDAAAPGGRINGGVVVELSYVDRPCNPTAKMAIAKAAGGSAALQPVEAEPDEVTIKVAGAVYKPSDLAKMLAKKSTDDAEPLVDTADDDAVDDSDSGADAPAEPTTPVADVEAADSDAAKAIVAKALRDAIKTVGRTKDPVAAKTRITQRAEKLGRDDLVPEGWKTAGADATTGGDEALHDANELATIRSGLIRLIHAELDELENGEPEIWDIESLLCSLRQFLNWWDDEAWSGKTDSPRETPKPGGADVEPDIEAKAADEETVEPDTTKDVEPDDDASTPDADTEDDTTKASSSKTVELDENRLTELVKSAVAEAKKSLTEQAAEERKTLAAELDKVKEDLAKALALPEPGGPVLSRTAAQAATSKAVAADKVKAEAAALIAKADQMQSTDRYTAQGYRDRAHALLKPLDA